MESKTILITGSTDGIGKVTAKALAKQGHTVIIHGRNLNKAKTVCAEIKSETGNEKIDFVVADLFLLADVQRMAGDFKKKYERLDVLINNAGAMFGKDRETTKEGLEKTMALNLFSPFLLTQLLLEILAKSPAARIINVSSSAHAMSGVPNLNDIQLTKNYSLGSAYGQSKLYLIWVTQYLAEELKKTGFNNITANSLHPGTIKTEFGQNADKGFIINLLFKLSMLFAVTPEQGAENTIYLATSKDVENITGRYFANKKVAKPNPKYYSAENEKIIWDYCMQIVQPYLNR
ncbi:SDR family NAD(P)-dependent oxidoreductase [Dyadobacter sp. CY345]|uniref:SDR family NAD(P)-dependent oxidoreductase n=1 Tax=Dyadobacter sp. CY345 TaxID=2909335 RepID=UPI001F44B552|nr:SDR family NAD(P)-dependent oxidoreductase [Dyadobacter sp. CY345]MCF2444028.1 SDR family NAD(P)-dependent oxidoreductase [Dyadobacter sp. CY345]